MPIRWPISSSLLSSPGSLGSFNSIDVGMRYSDPESGLTGDGENPGPH